MNQSHPMLDPLWRRIVIVAVCAFWCVIELVNAAYLWAAIAAAMTIWGAWKYLYAYRLPNRS